MRTTLTFIFCKYFPGSIPSTLTASQSCLELQFQGTQCPLLASRVTTYAYGVQTWRQSNIYIYKIMEMSLKLYTAYHSKR